MFCDSCVGLGHCTGMSTITHRWTFFFFLKCRTGNVSKQADMDQVIRRSQWQVRKQSLFQETAATDVPASKPPPPPGWSIQRSITHRNGATRGKPPLFFWKMLSNSVPCLQMCMRKSTSGCMGHPQSEDSRDLTVSTKPGSPVRLDPCVSAFSNGANRLLLV